MGMGNVRSKRGQAPCCRDLHASIRDVSCELARARFGIDVSATNAEGEVGKPKRRVDLRDEELVQTS